MHSLYLEWKTWQSFTGDRTRYRGQSAVSAAEEYGLVSVTGAKQHCAVSSNSDLCIADNLGFSGTNSCINKSVDPR